MALFNSLFRRSHESLPHGEMQEMILLTLARAEENGRLLAPSDLAHELGVAGSGLARHLAPLIKGHQVVADQAGRLVLADSGRDQARTLLRRHRLAERLFTDVLGLDWAHAHEEADRFEHIVSAEAEQQLASQLGDPDTCPHGNPIPDASRVVPPMATVALSDCPPSTCATITRIALETSAALQHLATLGLLPSVEIEVERRAPFDGPVLVRVGRAHYALGRDLAARIWVTRTHKEPGVSA
jgi:DtxR family Mn-dependent transcriptional regulator